MLFAPQRCAFNIRTSKSAPRLGVFYILTWKCGSRYSGVHLFDISTSKSALRLRCFVNFDIEMCFAPQGRALFQHLNFQKCSEPVTFLLTLLTSECASRHNGVCFFDMWTSKSGARMVCFGHFDFQIWLPNVLRATTARNFSSLIWPCGSAPAAVASLRSHKSLGKHSVLRLFYLFARLHLLSSDPFSSLIFSLLLLSSLTLLISAFPSVHVVGSLTSELPWNIIYHGLSWSLCWRGWEQKDEPCLWPARNLGCFDQPRWCKVT